MGSAIVSSLASFGSLSVLLAMVVGMATGLVGGLPMVGSLSGRKIIAGVVSAMFGVLLSMVGSSDLTGILRYGFGQVYLVDGLSLVAVALGIFAIPAVLDMHVNGQKGIGGERP